MISRHFLPLHRWAVIFACGWLLASALMARPMIVCAQDSFPEAVPVVKTYEWSLTPAKEAFPALKYKLLTDLSDTVPGNAAVHYNRAIVMKLQHPRLTAEQNEQQNEWYDLPIEKFPVSEVKKFVDRYQDVLNELKLALRCETCDWGIRFQDLRGMEVIEFRLPEFQETRDIARILRLKAKLEIADGRFDESVETIRQSYQLARDLATVPNIICNLIAVAIQSVSNDSVCDLVSMVDSPNLYWALRGLPDPLVNVAPAFQFESTMAFRIFPFLKDADTVERPADEWRRLLTDVIVSLDDSPVRSMSDPMVNRIEIAAMMMRSYPIAKQALIAAGYDRVRVDRMPVGQAIAVYARDCYQSVIDETAKWMLIPFAESSEPARSSWNKLIQDGFIVNRPNDAPSRDPLLINTRLGYHGTQLSEATNRQRRMVAATAAIEAIRMHAAANGGQLPDSLAAITVVPVPMNPNTGKPFLYRVVDQRAELLIPPTRNGDEYSGRRFLIRMR